MSRWRLPRRPRLRLRWPTVVEWIAVLLLAVTAGAVETWLHASPGDPWRPWMLNVAPAAFFVALTITVIDAAIRRRERARLEPLLGPYLGALNGEYDRFVMAAAEDYATTHAETFKPLPTRPLELLDFWLAEQESADLDHVGLAPHSLTLCEIGREFAEQVAFYESEVGAEMPPDLRAQCRNLARTPTRCEHYYEQAKQTAGMPPEVAASFEPERRSYRAYVASAREFGKVLARHRPAPVHDEVDADAIEWAEEARRQRLEAERLSAPQESG